MVIRKLERDVGVALLHRTTRSVQLTEDGRAFYSRARDLLAEVQELQSMFSGNGTRLRGRLRVDMPTELARSVVVPALPQLMAAHPELELELSSTDRRVDLVQEGFDCVIRLGPIADDTLIARPLGKLRMTNAASPGYLARYGIPHTLDDLRSQGHRMVHYTLTLGARHPGWEYPHGDGYASLPLPSAMQVNSVQTYHAAGLAGIGLIQAGYSALAHHIESGALVEVLPDLRPEPLAASLVVAHRRNLSPRVRAFMDWIEGVLAPYLD
ncbi:DNA-binding transcriptional LysR family regulator [Burkholderia ambifaria]